MRSSIQGGRESNTEAPLVWVTGAAGLIGNYLLRTATELGLPFKARGLTRGDVDLLDFQAVEQLFRRETPKAIIHCAAISKSPECEKHPELAKNVNFELTRFLHELACDIPFIFLSTDLVFDGKKGNYKEVDEPNPLSVYAETKVMAEQSVRESPQHTIVRTSLNAGRSIHQDRSFNEEMKRAWSARKSLNLFIDEYRSPIPAEETAKVLWMVLQHQLQGTYHIAGGERLSRFAIGEVLTTYLPQFKNQIVAGSRQSYQGPPRPPDTSLCCRKVEEALGIRMPMFSEWMKEHHAEIL